jgi:TonB family protein
MLISESGEVLETRVLRGARADAQFEKSAMEAVRQWKFKPAIKDGQAVRVWFNVAVPFQLRK